MPQALPMLAYYGAAQLGAVGTYAWVATAAAFVTSVVVADYQKQSAADKARAQAARDRTVNIRSGVAPRKLVLGTARLGGAVMYGEFVGPELEYLDMITALHHGDAGALTEVLGAYFDDEFVPAADLVDGVPTSGKYSGGALLETSLTEVQTLTASATITLPYLPVGEVFAIHNLAPGATGEALSQVGLTVVSVVGYVVTLSEPITGEVWVTYRSNDNPWVPLRLQWTTGSSSQASTSWAGVDTPKWTADHRLRGVSYMRTLMRTEDRVFATGLPQPSLVARAANGVWDPRSSTYVNGTSNPALLAAWFRMLPKADGGFSVPTDWIDWASVATAANICDELISVRKLDGAGYESIKRYECNTVLNLELPAADNLRVILGAMAGDFPFTAGKYRCYAGAFRAATVTLTDDDVCGEMPINFAPSTGAASPPNVVTARIYNRAKAWVEDGVPAVVNDAYVTADGREETMEIDLPACTDTRQANYLMGVRLEQMRPAMAGSLTVTGKGANLALIETVQLNLVGYEALAGRTFEIRRRTNHWNGRYTLELAEVKASTFTLDADRFTPPSTNAPGDTSELWNVTPVTLTSVVNATLTQSDGSHLDRALVTWAAHPQALVNPRGKIEVRYRAPGYEWVYAAPVPGDQTTTYIGPLGIGMVVFVEARAMNSLGVFSAWSGIDPFTVTGTNDVPPDVTGLSYEIKPGQVVVTWDDKPGLETELRYSAVPGAWALVSGATFLWAGVGTDYKHARPPNGTYRVWAAHRNRNFYSAAPQYVDITVDDSIDAGGTSGVLRLKTDGFPYFAFGTATTHTSTSPTVTITAYLINLFGTVTWSAEAFDASEDSLGPVTLGGSGNARTLSPAQFVAAGVSGSVRRVRVTGVLDGADDFVDFFRQDPSTTAPRLYLSNPRHTVQTDEAGEGGDYSDATTVAEVYTGLTNDTASYSISITPDAEVTATIEAGAGPVTGVDSPLIAVSDMAIDAGAVLIETSGPANLSASFVVTKRRARGAGYTAYWEPAELRLPLQADGSVASYLDARSVFHILLAGSLEVVDGWTLTPEYINVVGSMTGPVLQITDFPDLGETAASSSVGMSLAPGWERPQSLLWVGSAWLTLGYHSSTAFSHIKRSADFVAWTDVDVGTAGQWQFGGFDAQEGRVILPRWGAVTSDYIDSVDGGASWSGIKSFGASAQWIFIQASEDGVWLAGGLGTTAGRKSVNGGASWAGVTFPAPPDVLCPVGRWWYLKDLSDQWYVSADDGASWSAALSALAGCALLRGVAGRAVAIFSGTLAKYSEDGSTFFAVAVPQSYTVAFAQVVRHVLYLVGADGKVQCTDDGVRWLYAGGSAGGSVSYLGMRGLSADVDASALHSLYTSGSALHNRTPLLTTSATEGFVRLRATKPGESDLVRTLRVLKGAGVADVYSFQATRSPIYLSSTSDGVVPDFSAGSTEVIINKNGQLDTGGWSITWTTVNLSPASGTGPVVNLTGMLQAADTGRIDFVGNKPGQRQVTGGVSVIKIKGPLPAGPLQGGFRATETSATQLSMKFVGDGRVQIKRGSGGSYQNYAQWAGAISAGNAAMYWVRIRSRPGSPATGTVTGTLGTWQALTTDREWTYEEASPGDHAWEFDIHIATSSTGANAVASSGALELEVT